MIAGYLEQPPWFEAKTSRMGDNSIAILIPLILLRSTVNPLHLYVESCNFNPLRPSVERNYTFDLHHFYRVCGPEIFLLESPNRKEGSPTVTIDFRTTIHVTIVHPPTTSGCYLDPHSMQPNPKLTTQP